MPNVLIPQTFQHANAYIDWLSYYLTPQEEKVLNKAIREIIGWRDKIIERKARIALSVFTDGKKKNGKHVCLGCGLGESAVRTALRTLDEFNILCKVKDGKKQDITNNGQMFYLQEEWDNIEWGELKKRRKEWDKENRERTEKARKKRGVLSDITPNVGQHDGGNVGQGQRNPVRNPKKLSQQPDGCNSPSGDFSLPGLKVTVPKEVQTEYIEVPLYEYANKIICPECGHNQNWPKSSTKRKKKENLICDECSIYWLVTIEYETGDQDIYKATLPGQEWTIILDDPIPNIGNILKCDEDDAKQFLANWKENSSKVVEKLQWASTQEWLTFQRKEVVSRVNAAYRTSTNNEISKHHTHSKDKTTAKTTREMQAEKMGWEVEETVFYVPDLGITV